MEKLIDRVMQRVEELVTEILEQEVGTDLTAVRLEGELWRAIAEACLRNAGEIEDFVDRMKDFGHSERGFRQ
jgi:hypothetical protein